MALGAGTADNRTFAQLQQATMDRMNAGLANTGTDPESIREHNLAMNDNVMYQNSLLPSSGYTPTWMDMAALRDSWDRNRQGALDPIYKDLLAKLGGKQWGDNSLNYWINKYSYDPGSFAGFRADNPNFGGGGDASLAELYNAAAHPKGWHGEAGAPTLDTSGWKGMSLYNQYNLAASNPFAPGGSAAGGTAAPPPPPSNNPSWNQPSAQPSQQFAQPSPYAGSNNGNITDIVQSILRAQQRASMR